MTTPGPDLSLPPPCVEKPHTPVLNAVFGFVLGVVFVTFGLLMAWGTSHQQPHNDTELFAEMFMALLGGLIISPALVGAAIKSAGLALTQVWPGGKRSTDA